MSHDPYEPPKTQKLEREARVPVSAATKKSSAIHLLVLAVPMLIAGNYVNDRARISALPAWVVLAATAVQVAGGILLVLGIYRLYEATRQP